MKRFPWERVMQLGLGELRLSPREFWNSTLRELAMAADPAHSPLVRNELDLLMRRFPDT